MGEYLSHFLTTTTPAYGGEEGAVQLRRSRSIANGDTSNNLVITLPGHIGTHIDFPFHFSNEGRQLHDYPASFWVFRKVGVVEGSVEEFPEKLKSIPLDIELLIWKSGFGAQREDRAYWAEQPVIPAAFATMIRERFPDVRVFGFDMISLTSQLNKAEGKLAHNQFLLVHNILVLEDMKLDTLNSTPGTVIISPLQIAQADGVPCTVLTT